MTAPAASQTRIWRVDHKTAQRFLGFEKQPARGVKGTNRKFSPALVNRYAFYMLAGEWKYTHEGMAFIGFLSDGTADFKDGGHRCRALIAAATVGATLNGITLEPNLDIAIDVQVTEGLDEDSWRAMNIGKPKNAADFMAMDGEVKGMVLSATIALCHLYETEPEGELFVRDRWQKLRLTPIQRAKYLEDNPDVREATHEGARLSKIMTVSAASAGYYLAIKHGMDKKVVDDFMDLMHSGANMGPKHPALRLRELLKNARATSKRRIGVPREDQLALFIKALRAFAADQEIGNLSFRTKSKTLGGSEPFPRFPG